MLIHTAKKNVDNFFIRSINWLRVAYPISFALSISRHVWKGVK